MVSNKVWSKVTYNLQHVLLRCYKKYHYISINNRFKTSWFRLWQLHNLLTRFFAITEYPHLSPWALVITKLYIRWGKKGRQVLGWVFLTSSNLNSMMWVSIQLFLEPSFSSNYIGVLQFVSNSHAYSFQNSSKHWISFSFIRVKEAENKCMAIFTNF